MAGSDGWSPASCQKVLPESLGTRAGSPAPGAAGGSAVLGCPPPHPQSAQPPRLLQLGILSQQLRQDAHWTFLPPWLAGRDLAPHRARSDCGLAHLWGGSGQPGPPPCSQVPLGPPGRTSPSILTLWEGPERREGGGHPRRNQRLQETTETTGGQNGQEVSPTFSTRRALWNEDLT